MREKMIQRGRRRHEAVMAACYRLRLSATMAPTRTTPQLAIAIRSERLHVVAISTPATYPRRLPVAIAANTKRSARGIRKREPASLVGVSLPGLSSSFMWVSRPVGHPSFARVNGVEHTLAEMRGKGASGFGGYGNENRLHSLACPRHRRKMMTGGHSQDTYFQGRVRPGPWLVPAARPARCTPKSNFLQPASHLLSV